jgi:peptide deformylase
MIKAIITSSADLRQKCRTINVGEDISQTIKDLEDTLSTKRGFGLAANQIGYNIQVSVIRMKDFEINLINPTIIDKSNKIVFEEGCLSFPGLFIKTDRYKEITYSTGVLDDKGVLTDKVDTFAIEGLEAIVIQHEVSHLQGKLFLDFKHKKR